MKTSEFLQASRDRVEAGWCQNHYEDFRGNVCTSGAMKVQARADSGSFYAHLQGRIVLASKIEEEYPEGIWTQIAPCGEGVSIPIWNDMEGRTKQEVLNMYDKAILTLQELGQ